MKAGWKTVKLNDVSELLADGDWIESKDQSDDGIRLIQTGNIGDGTFKAREEKARYISESTFKRLRCTEIFEGDCLVSRLPEPVGRSCILPRIPRSITAVDCSIIRFKRAAIFPEYFCYYSQSRDYQRSVESKTSGTTRKRISRSHLSEIEIPLPHLAEQKRIVALLDKVFAGIDEAKAITERNQRSAQVLYLNSIREAFSKNSYGKVRLGEVCKTSSGGTPHKSHKEYYDAGAIPWLRSGEVCQREINNSECFITELGMANSSAKLFPPNTVLVAMYGATAGQVGILRFQSTTNQAVCGILPGAYMPEYLYYYFSSIKDELVAQAVGGAQPNISQEKIRDVLIPKVSNAEQSKVVKQLDGITAHASKLGELFIQKKSQYLSLKESLLAQAFAGELTA
jgi:type I restriction enzyme S subunit